MNRVIFLDLDGVMVSFLWILKNKQAQLNKLGYENFPAVTTFLPEAIICLNKIIEATSAQIVLTSSWRLNMDIDEIQFLMDYNKINGTVLESTPDFGVNVGARFAEIEDWLKHHPEVTNFVILDDMFDMGNLNEHFIRIDPQYGLELKYKDLAIKILEGDIYGEGDGTTK